MTSARDLPAAPHVRLSGHGFRARVDPFGAALADLRTETRPLLLGYEQGQARPSYAGSLLAPWPNRIRDGEYTFDGAAYRTPITDPDHGAALHGLIDVLPTTVVASTQERVDLVGVIAGPDYPGEVTVHVAYSLEPTGLRTTVRAVCSGLGPVPYGVSTHPYLVVPGPFEEWTIELPAGSHLPLDDRLLPAGPFVAVAGPSGHSTATDLRRPRPLSGLVLDHTYTDVEPDVDGVVTARLRGPDGAGVAISAAASWAPWWQVYTSDTLTGDRYRAAVAIEPMSCPGDAYRSGTDLVVLAPGEEHVASWTISPI